MRSGTVNITINPRKAFRPFLTRDERFSCVVAHRRSGKTYSAIQDLIWKALQNQRNGDAKPRYSYIAPTRDQAKDIAWPYLKSFTAKIPGVTVNESELRITLPKKQTIRLYSGDNYERMRGIYFDGCVIDEPADIDPKAWGTVIRPCLSDYRGWANFIGTPKGKNAFYKRHIDAREREDYFHMLLKASESGILASDELISIRRDITEDEWRQEYECDFNIGRPGAIYANDFEQSRNAGRIYPFPVNYAVPVYTCWDLGSPANTVVTYWQRYQGWHYLIDCDHHLTNSEGRFMKTGERVAHMMSKGYHYAAHLLPHDGRKTDYDGMSMAARLQEAGLTNVKQIPKGPHGAEEKRVQTMLDLFPSIRFNEENLDDEGGFFEAGENYHRKESKKDGHITNVIEHDWTSHFMDSFGYYGEALKHNLVQAGQEQPRVRLRRPAIPRNSPSR